MAERAPLEISERLHPTVPLDPAWDQPVYWSHPVLADGSLGSARGVFTQPQPAPIKHKLTTFTLFSKLPLDLRVYIWRTAVNFERVVRVYEEIEYPDSSSDSDHSEDEDENVRSIRVIDKELKRREYFSNQGQNQLEDHGFTSSLPKPELPTNSQLQQRTMLVWETTRVGNFYSPDPIPVLLHVCHESRELLLSYGYKLAFATRTSPGGIWFNFLSDILHLYELSEPEEASPTLDGGMWNIGQFGRDDLDCLQKLSLSVNFDYTYGGTVPIALHKAVQLCGNLKELLIVEFHSHDMERKNGYWYHCNDEEIAVVDLEVEEFWGHQPEWYPRPRHLWHDHYYSQRRFQRDFEPQNSSYADIAKEVEAQIRYHAPCFPDRKEWTTPKVRFVMFMARNGLGRFMTSREAYGRHIDNMYWKGVSERRKSYRPPSPIDLSDGMDVLRDLWSYDENPLARTDHCWYKQAREAIHSVRGWPSPFTMEWIEASEARFDSRSSRLPSHSRSFQDSLNGVPLNLLLYPILKQTHHYSFLPGEVILTPRC
jgi:hypothetical protein